MIKQLDLSPLDLVEKRKFFMRHFVVTGNKSQGQFKTFKYSVVCKDLQRAIVMTEAAHPGCSIFNVADQGFIDKVDS